MELRRYYRILFTIVSSLSELSIFTVVFNSCGCNSYCHINTKLNIHIVPYVSKIIWQTSRVISLYLNKEKCSYK